MTTHHSLIRIASALLGAATVGLAAPVNDDFANAIDLAGGSGTQTGTGNVDATLESGEPDCVYATTDNTVWFKWTASQSGTLNLSTTGSTNIGSSEWDAAICVYTGRTLATLNAPLVSQDTGLDESCSLPVTAGTTYFIQAGGYPNPPADVANNILLTWSFVPPLVTVNSPDVISIDVVRTDSTAVSGDITGSPVIGQTGLWNRLDGSTEPQTLATLTNGAGATAAGVSFAIVSKSDPSGFQTSGSGASGVVLAANDPERLWVTGDGTRTFAFTGLTTGATYGLVIFNTGSPKGIITINGGTPHTAFSSIFYSNEVADGTGKITVVVSFDGEAHSDYMEVSGFQLYPVAATGGYDDWATTNAGDQPANLDFDFDGVSNGVEYFMGATGSSFTANPPLVTTAGVRTVTWPHDPAAVIASFMVQVSENLTSWTDIVPPNASIDESNPNQVIYTLPSGAEKKFCRLVVTP